MERQGSGGIGSWLLRLVEAVDSSAQGHVSDTAPAYGCGQGCVQMVAQVC